MYCHVALALLLHGSLAAIALICTKQLEFPRPLDQHITQASSAVITYTTIADGTWNNASTWMGGLVPGSTINAADVVNIGHVVTYNVSGDLEVLGTMNIVNGTFRTELTGSGSSRSVFVGPGAEWNMCNARFYLPIKSCGYGCNTGSNLGGNFNNQNGAITIYNSTVEIAQNWNDNSSSGNGSRTFVGGCLKLGENFQNKGSVDLYSATCLEMGLHGSGNWLNEYQVTFLNNCIVKLVGSGNFENKGSIGVLGGAGSPDISILGISNGSVTNDAPWSASIGNFCSGSIGGSMAADFANDIANNSTPAACNAVENTACDVCPAGACQLMISIVVLQEPSCYPDNDGIITVIVDSASATISCTGDTMITYQWSDMQMQDTLFDLSPGTYTVTVTDASGCSATASVTLADVCLGCPDCIVPGLDAEVFIVGPHAIIYSGRIFDETECKTYFLYCIVNDLNGNANDISHTAFGDDLCANTCLDNPDDAEMGVWSLDGMGNVIFGPQCGTVVHGEDPTTGICGIKHDSNAGGGCYETEDCLDSDLQVLHVYLSIEGNVPESTLTIALKYGPTDVEVEVPGPGNCTDLGCVECTVELTCDTTVLRSGTSIGCVGADAPPPLPPYSVFDTVSTTGSCSVQFSSVTDIDATDPCNIVVTYTYYGWNDSDRDSIRDITELQFSCEESFVVVSATSPSISCPADFSIEGCDVNDLLNGNMTQFGYSEEDVTVSASGFSAEAGTPLVNDDCAFVVMYQDTASGSCPIVVTRTWRVMDDCGNIASCTQKIYIDDNTPPTIACTPLNFSCINEVPAVLDLAGIIYDDNCVVASVIPIIVNGTNECPRTITRTYLVTDGCGNTASCVQVIIVDDIQFPNLDCPDPVSVEGCDFQAVLDAGLSRLELNEGPPSPVNYEDFIQEAGSPSVSDNCSFDISYQDQIVNASCLLVVKRKYRVVDVCANVVTCTQEIIIHDTSPPSLIDEDDCTTLDMVLNACLAEGADFDPESMESAVAALYTDLCSEINVDYLFTEAGMNNSNCMWSFMFTYRISDACSNGVTCTVTRSGGEMEDPEWLVVPENVTVECDGTGNNADLISWLGSFGGSDNCGETTVTNNFGQEGHTLSDECGATGSALVTFAVTDACGHSVTTTSIFSIADTQAPYLLDMDDCSTLDQSDIRISLGEAEVFDPESLENAVANLYKDDCSALLVDWMGTTPGDENVDCSWSFTYTYRISDACTNSITCAVTRSGGFDPCPWPSEVVFVNNQRVAGAQTGVDWPNAMLTIEEALQVAALYPNIEEIWVAGGEYTLPVGSARTESYILISNVKLMGGFEGVVGNLTDRTGVLTIMSGDIGVDGDHSDNTYHVITVGPGITGAVLDGFTITEGNADGLSPHNQGAAILNEGHLTIIDCIITYWGAATPGRAVHSKGGGEITMKGSVILQN